MMFSTMANTDKKKLSDDSRQAYAVLYEQFMPKVYRYISFRIDDENMAQDLTSVVFEKALTKFDGFNHLFRHGYSPLPATRLSIITGFIKNMETW